MNDSGSALPSLPQVEHFDFHGDSLVAVIIDGREVAIPIRSVCGAIGLDVQSQSESLREHDVLSQGLRVVKIPVGNRVQSVLAISRRYLAFWLATITPSLVAESVRPNLIRYQEELVELLDALYDRLHARFCAELGTPRYDALPASKYQQTLDWLRARAAEYLPDDPEALPPLQESLL